MLDHDNGVALVAQSMENCQQVFDVLEMQAGGRFVQNIECTSCITFRQFLCQLDTLRFAARQGRRVLAKSNIGQADIHQGP